MKKVIIIALFVLLNSTFSFGQNLSVYGLEIGDSKYRVESVLESKGKTVKSGTTDKGTEYLKVTYPNIGGVTFDGCSCYFNSNDELYRVAFYSSYGGTGDPGMPWEDRFRRKTNECKNTFSTMLQNLVMKYGEPTTVSDEYVTWQIYNQRIKLEFTYQYDRNQYGWIDSWVSVGLEYEKIDLNSVDF